MSEPFAYYNEIDAGACRWLAELMKAKAIPQGVIDSRSIKEVSANDLIGFDQCHFFAGIGGWPYALQLAEWQQWRSVWTGSCPCQPYSTAGKGLGDADERNLWPDFYRLIRECRPHVVFGEQVEGAVRHGWLDGVSTDLEAEGYAVGACVLGAHSVGAPHIRQRLYWVADLHSDGCDQGRGGLAATGSNGAFGNGPAYTLADLHKNSGGRNSSGLCAAETSFVREGVEGRSDGLGLGSGVPADERRSALRAWGDSRPVHCRDGKYRRIPTQPKFFPLAHGLPGRVGLLRGYGNAIVPQVAAEFIAAWMESRPASIYDINL